MRTATLLRLLGYAVLVLVVGLPLLAIWEHQRLNTLFLDSQVASADLALVESARSALLDQQEALARFRAAGREADRVRAEASGAQWRRSLEELAGRDASWAAQIASLNRRGGLSAELLGVLAAARAEALARQEAAQSDLRRRLDLDPFLWVGSAVLGLGLALWLILRLRASQELQEGLLHRVSRGLAQEMALRNLDRMLLAEAGQGELLEEACAWFARGSGAGSCVASLDRQGRLGLRCFVGGSEAHWEAALAHVAAAGGTDGGPLLDGEGRLRLGSGIVLPELPVPSERGDEAGILLPVRCGDTEFGVVLALSPDSEEDLDERRALLEAYANQLGLGLLMVRERERQKLQQHVLRRAQRMETVGQLAGGLAHDFNNLLAAVVGHAQHLRDALQTGSPEAEDADQILLAADRAGALVRQLLAVTRRQPIQPVPTRMDELLRGLLQLLAPSLSARIEVQAQLPPDLPPVLADPGQIEQVVTNLALNARDAMPSGGRLVLAARAESLANPEDAAPIGVTPGDYVVLRVSDTGQGIRPEVLPYVFEPFFTTKGPGLGSGLGLAMSHGIVTRHGGRIRVESVPEVGTTFEVWLPQAPPSATAAAAAPEESPGAMPRGTETVLVVEDEMMIRRLIERTLTHLGYQVHMAEDGSQGLELFEQLGGKVDLVLTDLVMPRMGGVELAREVQSRRPDLPVLFMTGYAPDAVLQGLHPDEEFDVLSKPMRPIDLARKIRHVLARRAAVPA